MQRVQIGEYVRQQPVVHADETRHFRGNECRWLWTLVTLKACYFLTQVSRDKEAADTLSGDFSGYLVTDDYVGYNRFCEDRRQLCWPHLIRKFTDIGSRIGNGGKIRSPIVIDRSCHDSNSTPLARQPDYRVSLLSTNESVAAQFQGNPGTRLTIAY